MSPHDPNNPHPVRSSEWTKANQRYQDESSRRTGQHLACFPGETSVLTTRGARPIRDFRVGDEVLAVGPGSPARRDGRADRDGELRSTRVHHVPAPVLAQLLTIHLEATRPAVTATAHHAFRTQRGWVRAGELRGGDRVRRIQASGHRSSATVTRTALSETTAEVFNLIVEDDLTFIAAGYLVHSFGYARAPRAAWHRLKLAVTRASGFGAPRTHTPSLLESGLA